MNGERSSGKRTRHIDIRYCFICDRIASGELSVKFWPTEDMVGDFFTTPLQGAPFRKFRYQVLNIGSWNCRSVLRMWWSERGKLAGLSSLELIRPWQQMGRIHVRWWALGTSTARSYKAPSDGQRTNHSPDSPSLANCLVWSHQWSILFLSLVFRLMSGYLRSNTRDNVSFNRQNLQTRSPLGLRWSSTTSAKL